MANPEGCVVLSRRSGVWLSRDGWSHKVRVSAWILRGRYHPIVRGKLNRGVIVKREKIDQRFITMQDALSMKWYNSYLEMLVKKEPEFKDMKGYGHVFISGLPLFGGGTRRIKDVLEHKDAAIIIINDFISHGYTKDMVAVKEITQFIYFRRMENAKRRYYEAVKYNKMFGFQLKQKYSRIIRECERHLNMEPCDLPTM